MVEQQNQMIYRYLGKTGLRVSVFSYGNMVATTSEKNIKFQPVCIKKLLELGVNFFDTAEMYEGGACEANLGQVLKDLNVRREDVVISTKIFREHNAFDKKAGVNSEGLSRKHIIEGLNNSLKRLQMDYVDVVFCHRPDFQTPLEETVRAMSWLIDQGKAFYWGTSSWPPERITEAILLCEKLNLHKPVVEQPEYNMLKRNFVEKDLRRVFSEHGFGSTVWAPLAGGLLTGKYNDGVKVEDGRFTTWNASWMDSFWTAMTTEENLAKFRKLEAYAKELGYTQAQLALAWCIASKDVTTCLLGFTRIEQIEENLKALELYKKWTPEIENKVNEILNNTPEPEIDWKSWQPLTSRRQEAVLKP